VRLHIKDVLASVARLPLELTELARVQLVPGEEREMTSVLDAEARVQRNISSPVPRRVRRRSRKRRVGRSKE
jgi:hypothetical protein